MHKRFIVLSSSLGYGNWGVGNTQEEATANYKAAGGKINKKVALQILEFTSELPFAPSNRTALDSEADCWIDKYGGINWVRCERKDL